VKENKTRHGKPYIFINFGPWQGNIVKVSIWSEGLEALTKKPTQGWVGKWISVVGLMEPPYVSRKYKYSHLAISITQGSQLHVLTEKDAKFRLSSINSQTRGNPKSSNEKILEGLRSGDKSQSNSRSKSTSITSAPRSRNDAILQKMKGSQSSSSSISRGSSKGQTTSSSSSNCFIATAVYGVDASETNLLRNWRDTFLLPNKLGRFIVSAYYVLSPYLVKLIKKDPKIRVLAKVSLDFLIQKIK
jgi:hypothetical protein